jgi:DNA recombination protein RmuC
MIETIVVIQAIIVLLLIGYVLFNKNNSQDTSDNERSIDKKFSEIQLQLAQTINQISEKETRSREVVKDTMIKQLSTANEQLAKQQRDLINSDISRSKELLDSKLDEVDKKLRNVSLTITEVEKNNSTRHGDMGRGIKQQIDVVTRLNETTHQLKETLSSTKIRGQWGERLAEDVLRLAGFVENVNYTKQTTIVSGVEANQRPDFTFNLPNETKLHMDVKFPLENFVKMVETKDEDLQKSFQKQFVNDIKKHIKDLKTRAYHKNENSIPCVLLFLPNEQIFNVINETGYSLVDDALREGIVLCSPITLFSVLAVFRQGWEMFKIESASRDLFEAVKDFQNEWGKYDDQYQKSVNSFNKSIREFESLTGTRQNQLERKMGKVMSIGNEVENKELSSKPNEKLN